VRIKNFTDLYPALTLTSVAIKVDTIFNNKLSSSNSSTMNADLYTCLVSFIVSHAYPETMSNDEKSSLRGMAALFSVENDILYFSDRKRGPRHVVREGDTRLIIQVCHAGEMGGGHFGRDRLGPKNSPRTTFLSNRASNFFAI